MAEAMDNAKLVADAHKIARCVRGCATDAQYQELTANIEAALASSNEMNERLREALCDPAIRTLELLAAVNMQVRDDAWKLRELAECRLEAKRILPQLRALLQSIPDKDTNNDAH